MIRRKFVLVFAFSLFLVWSAAAWAKSLPEFTELADKAGAAVVNISTVKTVKTSQRLQDLFRFPRPHGGPFDDFFDQFEKFFRQRPDQKPRKQRSLGSGFIVSPDGYIVTNNHVIADADEVKVNIQGGDKSYDAKIVGLDPETDLALLKIKVKQKLPQLSFGDSDKARVGQWVVAIGNPFGLDHTVTAGIISAKGRVIGSGPFDDFIQTDASINPGNSGGPLLNMDGEVIGINTAIIASGQGIGFAIPSNMAGEIIAQLKKDKKVLRGWLGVTIQDLDENTAKALDLKEPQGALIASVLPGQPAEKAGLESGDVILAVDDELVEDMNALLKKIASLPPGRKTKLTVWRKGEEKIVSVKLGQRDPKQLAKADEPENETPETELGLAMRPVEQQEALALGLDKAQGLLVTGVSDGSPAQEGEIHPGDVILELNQREVNSVREFKDILESDGKKKGVLLLLIHRRGKSVFRTITLPKK
ncbi:MAG: DegQ family serine endoprotease [Thermodesulfobacteriota bacterium]|nr:DegQ family serine endoprotease [Thermodesulfobacteriota bacterium]